jgi:DNA-directed RNA polymerase
MFSTRVRLSGMAIGTRTGDRRDIYSEVAERVAQRLNEDAGAGDELAKLWLGNVTRKTVKRAVMTSPYGVTERGIARQLMGDGSQLTPRRGISTMDSRSMV